MDKPEWMWISFFAVVLALLVIDLGVLNRKAKVVSVRASLWLTVLYVGFALLYGGWIWLELGQDQGKDYLSGYVVEKMLAMDNIFVMSLIFSYFAIPREYQHRVLFWGILGAIILRGIAISLGTVILEQFEWMLLIFAAFLIFTGVKMLLLDDEQDSDFSNNRVLKFMQRFLPITPQLHENYFSVKLPDPKNPAKLKRFFTPLFLALVLVECADIIFAMDSIPAIFAITTDPYLVYTSNIFAILGLRAMYFLLSAAMYRFEYLKFSVSAILVFIGAKVLLEHWIHEDVISELASFSTIMGLLAMGVFYSLIKTAKSAPDAKPAD